jgi:hypothetical protein
MEQALNVLFLIFKSKIKWSLKKINSLNLIVKFIKSGRNLNYFYRKIKE